MLVLRHIARTLPTGRLVAWCGDASSAVVYPVDVTCDVCALQWMMERLDKDRQKRRARSLRLQVQEFLQSRRTIDTPAGTLREFLQFLKFSEF